MRRLSTVLHYGSTVASPLLRAVMQSCAASPRS